MEQPKPNSIGSPLHNIDHNADTHLSDVFTRPWAPYLSFGSDGSLATSAIHGRLSGMKSNSPAPTDDAAIPGKSGAANPDLSAELQSSLEAFRDPAILLSPDYTILATNSAYEATYSDGSPMVGRKCYEVSHHYRAPCDQAGENCPLKECIEKDRAQRVLHLHHTPRGEEHVDVHLTPVRNAQGELEYFIEVMHQAQAASTSASAPKGLIGRSPPFNRMLELIQRVAPRLTTVLLLGPSGTGKELAALALHEASTRSNGPFVPVDCSGLTETLFESELFGHEKGAFTGAQYRKVGLVEAARGGTLFLDEIGDVPLDLQVKLLRLLETNTFRRVGSVEPQQADFRLVCATHRNLRAMIAEGTFREDLYYRIGAFPIELPSLAERVEDLPLLARSLLQRLEPERELELSNEALNCLSQYAFPGNIRELRNILERASVLCHDNIIRPDDLPPECQCGEDVQAMGSPIHHDRIVPLKDAEHNYLRWAAARFPGDRRELANRLGISERSLYRKLQRLEEDGAG